MDCLATEQDLANEAEEMVNSWNMKTILEEIKDGDMTSGDRVADEYYDGITSFDEIKADMIPLADGKVHIKHIKRKPDGKQITAASHILYDFFYFLEYRKAPIAGTIYDGKPCKADLSYDQLPGVLIGLIQMREGEEANILVHPALGYGPYGAGPTVPPDSYLYYHVKIHKVYEPTLMSFALSEDRYALDDLDTKDILLIVEENNKQANELMKDSLPKEALIKYKEAVDLIKSFGKARISSMKDLRDLLVTSSLNAAIALNKLGSYKSATKHARRALKYDPKRIKVYYHLAKARIGLMDYVGAKKYLDMADQIAPNEECLVTLKRQIVPLCRGENEKEIELLKKMSQAYL